MTQLLRNISILLLLLGLAPAAHAQSLLTSPDLTWSTIDGGGGRSISGTLALEGTIGQPDSGGVPLTAGSLALTGGFWPGTDGCVADFNGDGFVDIYDFTDYVNCFEGIVCLDGTTADANGDGFVDIYDFTYFVTAFENGC